MEISMPALSLEGQVGNADSCAAAVVLLALRPVVGVVSADSVMMGWVFLALVQVPTTDVRCWLFE
jgi:hypothetical protein